jgi:integral membrane protein (TIGR01906 family)
VATLSNPARHATEARAGAGNSSVASIAIAVGTALGLLAVSLAVLLTPTYIHAALDSARSAERLGIPAGEAERLSDLTVTELLLGPGSFAFAGPDGRPFYGAAEAAHLRDARLVLFLFLAVALVAAVIVALSLLRARDRRPVWSAMARGAATLATGLVVVGAGFLLAFDWAFEMFHRIFFPGGNWAFDPATQRLVQLYPIPFWQLTSTVLGVVAIAVSIGTWLYARRRSRG